MENSILHRYGIIFTETMENSVKTGFCYRQVLFSQDFLHICIHIYVIYSVKPVKTIPVFNRKISCSRRKDCHTIIPANTVTRLKLNIFAASCNCVFAGFTLYIYTIKSMKIDPIYNGILFLNRTVS